MKNIQQDQSDKNCINETDTSVMPYSKPKLIKHGSISELVNAGANGLQDAPLIGGTEI